jgi:hypothetical protein
MCNASDADRVLFISFLSSFVESAESNTPAIPLSAAPNLYRFCGSQRALTLFCH